MSCSHPDLDACGCCNHPVEPEGHNRAGLPTIDYRIGTHSTFFRHMRERISLQTLEGGVHAGARPLAALGTRDTADPSVALLDTAAVMLDVLSFYQERIANENFLRTATERRSILDLARAIGYELSPGVAADVALVFHLDETPGAEASHSIIPAGTKLQSLPVDGVMPQTFETRDDFTGYLAWNELKPRQFHRQDLTVTPDGTLQRINEHGNSVWTDVIRLHGLGLLIEPGRLVLINVTGGAVLRRVDDVEELLSENVTRISLHPANGAAHIPTAILTPAVYVVTPVAGEQPITTASVQEVLAEDLSESDLHVLLEDRGWPVDEFLAAAQPLSEPQRIDTPSATFGVFLFETTTGIFGHNALAYDALPVSQREGEYVYLPVGNPPVPRWTFVGPVYPNSWEGRAVWEDSQGDDYTRSDLYLERDIDDVLDEGWIVLEGRIGSSAALNAFTIEDRDTTTLADYGMSSKVTGLTLNAVDTTLDFQVRRTKAHVASVWSELALTEITAPITGATVALDRMIMGLRIGQDVMVRGETVDPAGVTKTEVATIAQISHHEGRTTIVFDDDLEDDYVRSTFVIQANLCWATHGETVGQPLASGDGAQPNQSFTLPRSPLTYVSAPTTSGRESTLELRVNGRLWEQRASLYGAEPTDQIYTVRIADDTTPAVHTGDGVSGARLPTGVENVTGRYRVGIGPDGEVDADTIQLILTKPPGVKSVNNPLPAGGAESPETMATARDNAPMTVRTLDRVVSLTDFEDFAATFAGIGKARADVIRLVGRRLVHITVGSATAGSVSDEKIDLLLNAMNNARDPGETVCVSSYRPLSFDVTGSLKTDPALESEAVAAEVHARLKQAFSFEQRAFAQSVSVAEIMAVIHSVAGVVATDIDQLEVHGTAPSTLVVPPLVSLTARPARLLTGATALGCGDIKAADLLLVNPNGIQLGVMP